MNDPAPPIRVDIVEDQREIREGLRTLVSGTPGYRVTGAWRSMEEALGGIGREAPELVLVDIGLPGMSGTQGLRILRSATPTCVRWCSRFRTMMSASSARFARERQDTC